MAWGAIHRSHDTCAPKRAAERTNTSVTQVAITTPVLQDFPGLYPATLLSMVIKLRGAAIYLWGPDTPSGKNFVTAACSLGLSFTSIS